jgi:hypothetical protein
MSTNTKENGKTAWDRAAEKEWIDEQWAADEHRRAYQTPGLHLQPAAAAALGAMSPEGTWLQITNLVFEAIEEYWQEAEKMAHKLNIGEYWTNPKDLNQVYIRATELNPIFAINEFNYVNPEVKLDQSQLERMNPLEALRAVIRMWTDNNHRSEAI